MTDDIGKFIILKYIEYNLYSFIGNGWIWRMFEWACSTSFDTLDSTQWMVQLSGKILSRKMVWQQCHGKIWCTDRSIIGILSSDCRTDGWSESWVLYPICHGYVMVNHHFPYQSGLLGVYSFSGTPNNHSDVIVLASDTPLFPIYPLVN